MDSYDFVQALRSHAPYISTHRNKHIVIVADTIVQQHQNFFHDIALLMRLDVKPVIVLDCGVTQNSKQLGPAETQVLRACAADNEVQAMAKLAMTRQSTTITGADRIRAVIGNAITAMPQGVIDGIDRGALGHVRHIDATLLTTLLNQHICVLTSPIGTSLTGELFLLDTLTTATAIAIAIKADKLIIFSADSGISCRQWRIGEDIQSLHTIAAEARIPNNIIDHALRACRHGVARAHILPSDDETALLCELYSRDGSGLMISTDRYDMIRTATVDDIPGLLSLFAPLIAQQTIVVRQYSELEQNIGSFIVIERDGMIIGSAALRTFDDANTMGELHALAVHADYQRAGRAAELVARINTEARAKGLTQLFVLTTQTAHWFIERGFKPGHPQDLPPSRQRRYNNERNAKVLIASLLEGNNAKE